MTPAPLQETLVAYGQSQLTIDAEGRIDTADVSPEDLDALRPVLEAALPRLPQTITVAGRSVVLPADARAELKSALGLSEQVWRIVYLPIPRPPGEYSYLMITVSGQVVRSFFRPGEERLFQPVLDAAAGQ